MNYYTTLEQSKKLIELGLDPKTADMAYAKGFKDLVICSPYIEDGFVGEFDLPCWSLGALISVLPCFIKEGENEYCLSIFPDGIGKWVVDYSTFDTDECFMDYLDDSLLDALYYMCCFLLERNYIKKGETK